MRKREIVIVSDNFYPCFTGGAELTTYALTSQSPAGTDFFFINASQLNFFHLALHRSKFWIFTNVERANKAVISQAAKILKYAVVEYDFKCCFYRSPDKHKNETGRDCDCRIPEMNELLTNAKHVFFMSYKQRDFFINEKKLDLKCSVLSSCFTKSDIAALNAVSNNRDANAKKWMILYSDSWVKGTDLSIRYAVKEGIDYQLVESIEHLDLLNMFGMFKGLIYKPAGADTCPRIVIEARLAGCELILNDNVLHRDEEWFSGDRKSIEDYLKSRPAYFWSTVEEFI